MNKIIAAFAMFALLGSAATAQAANEVKVLEVSSTVQSYYIGFTSSHFEVLVANLGYTKQVNVHAQLSDGSWTDVPLAFNRVANNNYEVWSGDVSDYGGTSRFGSNIQFAVNYLVNGQSYWDNNNGGNYSVPVNAGVILYNANVYNRPFSANAYIYSNNLYYGAVTVKNLAPTKDVKVVYSVDGWKTSKTVSATYDKNYWTNNYVNLTNPSPAGFEEWSFNLDVGSTATQVDYAISYTVNGQTYWDNNFGHNYTASLIHTWR